jgi:thymidylate synthase ThyX
MLDEDARTRIAPYVTDTQKPVFCLRNLPEEVVAVLFAYYSRSRDDLRTNLAKLLSDEELAMHAHAAPSQGAGEGEGLEFAQSKAREFHEKWVVGYGHASVAEHAVAHVALEGISIVASKAVEDTRLAAFTEKSTRYVLFDAKSFVPLDGALPRDLAETYSATARALIDLYVSLYEPTVQRIKQRVPVAQGQTPRAYEAAIRAQACDVLRYLLPAGVRTNVGMTINGRALEHLLKKMNGSALREVRSLAVDLRQQASVIIPTLLKYVEPSEHRTEAHTRVRQALAQTGISVQTDSGAAPSARPCGSAAPSARPCGSDVLRVHHDEDALARVVAAMVYEQSQGDYRSVQQQVASMSEADLRRVWESYVAQRGKFDAPLRALEHTSYTFDVLLDYGAFRDMQRHRMQTQTVQRLGMHDGYEIPAAAHDLGLESTMRDALDRATEAWSRIARTHPDEAQYVVPLAARTRYLLTCNLREVFHMVELRSARQGHVSYRNVAQQMWQCVRDVHPWAAASMRVDLQDYQTARTG